MHKLHALPPASPPPTNVDAIRCEVTRIIGAGAAEIVAAAVVKAKEGQFQAMKYLFELAGIHPPRTQDEKSGDLSLARLLCREIGLLEEPVAGEEKQPSPDVAPPAPPEPNVK